MRTFYLLLAAHAVSLVGTHVTGFALSVWMYQKTGSITLYGAVLLSSMVPGILVAPLGGVLTDRWNRRLTLLLAHAGGGACALGMALAYQANVLTLEVIIPLLMLKSAFETITTLAFSASVAAFVPADGLDRANGLVQLSAGIAQIASPAAAGMLLPLIHVGGIFVIDLLSFLFAVGVLLGVRMPEVARKALSGRSTRAFLGEAAEGLRYLRGQPGLVGLAFIACLVNFSISSVQFLFAPLLLSFASLRALGFTSSLAGVGLVVGSVALSLRRRPPRRRVAGLLGFMTLQGGVLLIAVAKPSIALATIGAFGVFALMPFIAGGGQTLWQQMVPLGLQGRAFAFRMMLDQTTITAASVIAGPLSDWIFEPLMAPGGALAPVLGPLIGVGRGRGIALLIAVLGVSVILASSLARLYRPLTSLDELPEPSTPGPVPEQTG